MSNIFNLNWKDVISAIISAVVVAVIGYILTVANVFGLDLKEIINVAVLAGLGSLLTALGTTQKGNFMGVVKHK